MSDQPAEAIELEALEIVRKRLVAHRRLVAHQLAGRGADTPVDPGHVTNLVDTQKAIAAVDIMIAEEESEGHARAEAARTQKPYIAPKRDLRGYL